MLSPRDHSQRSLFVIQIRTSPPRQTDNSHVHLILPALQQPLGDLVLLDDVHVCSPA